MGGRRAGEVPLPAVAFSPGKASRDTRLSLRFAVVPPSPAPSPRSSAAPGTGGGGNPKALEGRLRGAATQSVPLPQGHSLSRELQTHCVLRGGPVEPPGGCGWRREAIELVREIAPTRFHHGGT